jgi:hypothetical protein
MVIVLITFIFGMPILRAERRAVAGGAAVNLPHTGQGRWFVPLEVGHLLLRDVRGCLIGDVQKVRLQVCNWQQRREQFSAEIHLEHLAARCWLVDLA